MGWPSIGRAVINTDGMFADLERVNPAAQLDFGSGGNRTLCQAPVKFTFIDDLRKWSLRSVDQHFASRRDGLNASYLRQDGLRRKVEAPESLVPDHSGANRAFANPALGLEEDHIEAPLCQQ